MIFHPLQYPLARGLIAMHPDAELWYWRWDRYEAAYDATARQRERLEDLHLAASLRAAVNIVVSDALGEGVGGAPLLVPLAADSFPAPDPTTVVAVSLGHLGHRTDWALLRAVTERMPELTLLLIGEWHDDECGHDEDYQACRGGAEPGLARPPLRRGGGAADRAARTSGSCPFEKSEFNETALPYRIVKYAKLGRRTIAPDLKGVRTWERAVTIADGPEEWIAALRARAGRAREPRRSSCASGRWSRPRTSRTGRCGSAWRRWGSRAGGWAPSASAAPIRAQNAVPRDGRVARTRQVDPRRRARREPVAAHGLLAEREDLDAASAGASPSARRSGRPAGASVRPGRAGRSGTSASRTPGPRAPPGRRASRSGCRGWRG